jgi:apolipoprotein D and lipocalin family protein
MNLITYLRCGCALLITALSGACATTDMQPLQAIDRPIELQRFMGDWYVLASIPIDFWIASEAGAHNGIESYELRDDGKIATTYTFLKDGFDGPEKTFSPVAWVKNTATNTEWRMQFLWPFRSAYLIAYLDDDYQRTIIGVPNRDYAWIMSRSPNISSEDYANLIAEAGRLGYATEKIQRVPQKWPAPGQVTNQTDEK